MSVLLTGEGEGVGEGEREREREREGRREGERERECTNRFVNLLRGHTLQRNSTVYKST